MRSILKQNKCPVCRRESDKIFVVSDGAKKYSEIASQMWDDNLPGFTYDASSDMYFESNESLLELQNRKKFICKLCQQDLKQKKSFKNHLFEKHQVNVCDLCFTHTKLFPIEHDFYTKNDLMVHKMNAHVQCGLCFLYFFDERELLQHIRNSHYFCELCPVEDRPAFIDYEGLEKHSRQAHFVCEESFCREDRSNVFLTYDLLKEHYQIMHPQKQMPVGNLIGFRISGEEEERKFTPTITNTDEKTYRCVGELNEEEKKEAFPALGNPQKSLPKEEFPSLSPLNPFTGSLVVKKNNKKKKPKHQAKPQAKPQPSIPDQVRKQLHQVNIGKVSEEEFVNYCKANKIVIDNAFTALIKGCIVSRDKCEKVLTLLQGPPPKVVAQPPKRTNKKSVKTDDFPELTPVSLPERTFKDDLLQNIVILNNGLIHPEAFAKNVLDNVPESEIQAARNMIREKVKDKTKANTALKALEEHERSSHYESSYPQLSENTQKTDWKEQLKNNTNLLKSKLISDEEFIQAFREVVPKHLYNEAIAMIGWDVEDETIIARIRTHNQTNKKLDSDFPTLRVVHIQPKRKQKSSWMKNIF